MLTRLTLVLVAALSMPVESSRVPIDPPMSAGRGGGPGVLLVRVGLGPREIAAAGLDAETLQSITRAAAENTGQARASLAAIDAEIASMAVRLRNLRIERRCGRVTSLTQERDLQVALDASRAQRTGIVEATRTSLLESVAPERANALRAPPADRAPSRSQVRVPAAIFQVWCRSM